MNKPHFPITGLVTALAATLSVSTQAADLSTTTTIKPIAPISAPVAITPVITATPEVTGFQPASCVAKGASVTIQGKNFGVQTGRAVALGGNAVHVDLVVSSWGMSSIVATIPNDGAIVAGKTYYIGVEKTGHTQWLSNIDKYVTICAATAIAPIAVKVPTVTATSSGLSSAPTAAAATSEPTPWSSESSSTATTETPVGSENTSDNYPADSSRPAASAPSSSGSLLQSQLPPPPANLPPAPAKQDPSVEPGELMVVSASIDEANAVVTQARNLGLGIKRRTNLGGLGFVVTVLRVPKEMNIGDALNALRRDLPNTWADANHRYQLMAGDEAKRAAAQLIGWTTTSSCGSGIPVGMIDTGIDTGHAALGGRALTVRSFLASGVTPAKPAHGTATAALLVGQGDVEGLLPGAKLFAGVVFRQRSEKELDTTADAVVQALDWLATEHVVVINLSLGGPRNLIVEAAIQRILSQGIAVVAAAGNGGPNGKAVYPAAQDGVIAVTAVDAKLKSYERANRGDYISFSAPGVDVHTAAPGGGTVYVSGTSYAAPFVTAAVAIARSRKLDPQSVQKQLQATARDLGAPGKDPVFGWGLISATGCGKAVATKK